jgi:hypothetical protein
LHTPALHTPLIFLSTFPFKQTLPPNYTPLSGTFFFSDKNCTRQTNKNSNQRSARTKMPEKHVFLQIKLQKTNLTPSRTGAKKKTGTD